jgi:hypothetical protein
MRSRISLQISAAMLASWCVTSAANAGCFDYGQSSYCTDARGNTSNVTRLET